MKAIHILSLFCLIALVGCQHNDKGPRGAPQTTTTPGQTTVIIEGSESDALGRLISDVQTAQTPQAEAEAVRRLRQYEKDHNLTYATRSYRTYDNAVISDPSVSRDPLRTEVTIFRGRETLKSFQFIPKDNRNLAQLGE
jgi:hypothetical protein